MSPPITSETIPPTASAPNPPTWASAANNALNLSDMRAVKYLSDQDSLRKADALDLINLVPRGAGLRASAQGEGGFYLGGPFGSHLSFGISARGSGYGSFHIDDQAVSLLRDGNGTGANFSLGTSKGGGLATAEGGAHAIIRLGPMGSPDGVRVNLGFGGRYLRPGFYARAGSTLSNGGTILITPDSIAANVAEQPGNQRARELEAVGEPGKRDPELPLDRRTHVAEWPGGAEQDDVRLSRAQFIVQPASHRRRRQHHLRLEPDHVVRVLPVERLPARKTRRENGDTSRREATHDLVDVIVDAAYAGREIVGDDEDVHVGAASSE